VNTWIAENSMVLIIALAAATAVLLLTTVALLIGWLHARRGRSRETTRRIRLDRERLDLELSLAEKASRLRIIRELHEVSVHDMSVIIGQADGARYAGESDPTAAVRASAVIADVARSTLADLRRVMTVVRDAGEPAGITPELQDLGGLLDVMTEAGLRITVQETGERYALGPGAELAIQRILQESLTNALTHGGEGTQVTVVFTWTEEGFQLRVDDDGVRNQLRRSGRNPNDASQHPQGAEDDDLLALTGVIGGAGITEMRERTELFGGVFTSSLNAGVGFSIAASFPSLRYHNGVHGVNLEQA
jgi:signal transduction histidine kinase